MQVSARDLTHGRLDLTLRATEGLYLLGPAVRGSRPLRTRQLSRRRAQMRDGSFGLTFGTLAVRDIAKVDTSIGQLAKFTTHRVSRDFASRQISPSLSRSPLGKCFIIDPGVERQLRAIYRLNEAEIARERRYASR